VKEGYIANGYAREKYGSSARVYMFIKNMTMIGDYHMVWRAKILQMVS
jgi:hypothetical protein